MKCWSECTKINNPVRNLLLPAIVFAVVDKVFGYLFYAKLFKNVWEPYASLWRPMELVNYWCFGMTAVGISYALIISFLYTKICDLAKKQICLVGFAFGVFIIGRFVGEIYDYLMYPYDLKVMFLGLAHGFFVMISWALISKKIFVINSQN